MKKKGQFGANQNNTATPTGSEDAPVCRGLHFHRSPEKADDGKSLSATRQEGARPDSVFHGSTAELINGYSTTYRACAAQPGDVFLHNFIYLNCGF
jgi:hypothetical protein